jgi:hypothetical protein
LSVPAALHLTALASSSDNWNSPSAERHLVRAELRGHQPGAEWRFEPSRKCPELGASARP